MRDLHNSDKPSIVILLEELSRGNNHFKEVCKKVDTIENINYRALSLSVSFMLEDMRQSNKWFNDLSEDHFVKEVFKIYARIQ